MQEEEEETEFSFSDNFLLFALGRLLSNSAKNDFKNMFREVYNNEIGRSMGGDESLFENKSDQGGPPRKRRRISPPFEGVLTAPVSMGRSLVSQVYSMLIKFPNDNGNYRSAANKINKWWKRMKQYLPTANGVEEGSKPQSGFAKCMGKQIRCPLTLDPIPLDDVAKLISPEGRVVMYTCSSLVGYLRSTQDFRCPLLRYQFTRPQVQQLKKQANAQDIDAFDLLGLFDTKEQDARTSAEMDSVVTGLERTCADVFASGVALSEDTEKTATEILRLLEVEILPEWRNHVQTLSRLNHEVCSVMLQVEIERLQKLGEKIPDPNGVLEFLINELKEEQQNVISIENNRNQLRFIRMNFLDLINNTPFLPPAPPPPPIFHPVENRRAERRARARTPSPTMEFQLNWPEFVPSASFLDAFNDSNQGFPGPLSMGGQMAANSPSSSSTVPPPPPVPPPLPPSFVRLPNYSPTTFRRARTPDSGPSPQETRQDPAPPPPPPPVLWNPPPVRQLRIDRNSGHRRERRNASLPRQFSPLFPS